MIKKIVYGIIAVIVLFLVIVTIHNRHRLVYFFNLGIWLPNPQKVEVFNSSGYGEDDKMVIWHFDDNNKEKLTKHKRFTKISKENLEPIKALMEEFQKNLGPSNRKIFDETIKIGSLVSEGNYAIQIKREIEYDTFYMLILDYDSNKMFYFKQLQEY